MPFYDYDCTSCGAFRALKPMREAGTPQPCPRCGTAAARALAAPMLGTGSAASGWLGRPAGGRGGWRAACGFGCGHPGCAR